MMRGRERDCGRQKAAVMENRNINRMMMREDERGGKEERCQRTDRWLIHLWFTDWCRMRSLFFIIWCALWRVSCQKPRPYTKDQSISVFCSEMSESSRAGSAASRCTQLLVGSLNSATFIPSSLAFCCLEKIFLVEASEGNKIKSVLFFLHTF